MPPKETPQTLWLRKLVEKYPSTSQRGIARIAYAEKPEWFADYEACRGRVRRICGSYGKRHRLDTIDKSQFRAPQSDPLEDFIPPPLSEDLETWAVQKLPRKQKWLVLADVHVPFHDRQALNAAIDKGKDEGCTSVLLLGDFMDFYSCSRFDKTPNLVTLREERDMTISVLAGLRDHFPDAENMVWLLGNHEERWEAFLIRKAEELFDLPDFELAEVCRASALGITVIGKKQPLTVGKLHIIHGHEFAGSWYNPVNPARGLFLRAKVTAVGAHNHQTSEHSESALDGVNITCWSVGCLCGLHPRYMPINKWNHGFAVIDDTDKTWTLDNYRIHDGEVR